MNTLLNTPNALPVSLGWHCHVAMFLQDLGDLEKTFFERNVFDWFGIPMWTVCELIDRNFDKMTDPSCIVERARFTSKPDKILSHTEYDIRFLHEFKTPSKISEAEWKQFQEKYARRITRFQQILNYSKEKQKKVLFFRAEQDLHNKIIYPEFVKAAEHDEKYYVEYFADQMKQRGVSFTILFFTTSFQKGYDADRNILYIQFAKKNPSVQIGADELMKILQANLPFVRRYL